MSPNSCVRHEADCSLFRRRRCAGQALDALGGMAYFRLDGALGWNDQAKSILCKGVVVPAKGPAVPLPSRGCWNIEQLTVSFTMGDTGTDDTVDAVINGSAFELAKAPTAYQEISKLVDMKAAFGTAALPLEVISRIGIQSKALARSSRFGTSGKSTHSERKVKHGSS